jgi:cation diffusion facilitator CzcD-associated flavoprotein CzcO
MTDPITVTIIGAGMSGIAQAIALKQSLGPSVKMTIFERSHAPGGVWRDSKWPGAGVDIPIHLYSLWNAPKADWSRVYAEQPEVLRYLTGLIEEHGKYLGLPEISRYVSLSTYIADLSDYFVYNTTYLSSTWNPQTCIHTIQLQPSDSPTPITHTSQILISANGPLSSPLIPRIPGRESFQGPAFHNLNWDSTIDFQNKKVAVIGNGSSGIQFIPGLSEIEGCEVVQFIRSGGYYFPKSWFYAVRC